MDKALLQSYMYDASAGSASALDALLADATRAAEDDRLDQCEVMLSQAVDRADRAKHEIEQALDALRRYRGES